MTDGDAQLIIAVKGKVDYAATLAAHDLIIRFAVAGMAPNIAAPVVIRIAPRGTFAQAARPPTLEGGVAPAAVIADRPAPVAASAPVQTARLEAVIPRQARATQPLVMIDPGHGGHDPGTEAASGVAEKGLALSIATRVQRALEARGISAELTRADDRFISLAERTRIANERHADLFVSVHLNSSPNAETTGIETYYLNNTTDRATIRLARMENMGGGDSGDSTQPNLNYILTDLRQGDKANESMALARMIEGESVAALATAPGIRVNALGAKQGPFYVLVGAAMPAVLVECGFLSNRGEADHLNDQAYQQGLADGIATAVADYFGGNVAVGNL
jgi:N-acetylmuramoyl-L-alanine amidase